MNIERDKKITLNITAEPSARRVDEQLYDGFIPDGDRAVSNSMVSAEPAKVSDFLPKLKDDRLKALLPLYKARNYPKLFKR